MVSELDNFSREISNPSTIFNEFKHLMLLYNCALREVDTKLTILNDEFQVIHDHNPIEHIKSRIKTPESIVKKLKRKGFEITAENMKTHISDIAGIRVICSFTSDIYKIFELITSQSDITLLKVKDYIKSPKPNGYRSLHLLVEVPVFLSEKTEPMKVEIQIRTVAMDFWASLEHKIHYKFEKTPPQYILDNLKLCADTVNALDAEMLMLNEEIQKYK
ncbi:RelA/SpoT domain protein [Clostridium cellulovorans 743B]|uniref:RelA/SpoT domain protein n=1 Tax=Clostridium cellulovorans (strain ATCC 35296 / DSM 3052 / OCM 3 / 743B) TaxID=573061 RepID=D9SMA4_CLOC7|nr:GTP pyrophosphokinase family protein [Clostridium cellulovorans]ADL53760.1 RelA/SpoT domain protein [Clostridium cellulovorans 743B]